MKNKRVKFAIFGGIVVVLLMISVFSFRIVQHNNLLKHYKDVTEITYDEGSYLFESDDYSMAYSFCDYCFEGEVTDVVSVQNDSSWQKESGTSGQYYTTYKVRVDKTIKNTDEQLSIGKEINIMKYGGWSEKDGEFYLLDGDIVPQIGNKYLFFGSIQTDGSLLVSGPGSSIEEEDIKTAEKMIKEDGKKEYKRKRFKINKRKVMR